MRISVIVPVYNGHDLLRKCIDSILAQTYPDIEVVIVNDGSTDDTRDIAEEYKRKYDNIIVVHKQNEGLPQARKTGVGVSTGQYIGFVDADDWIEPDMCSKLYDALKRHHAEVASVGYLMEYEHERKIMCHNSGKEFVFDGKHALKGLNQRKYVFSYAWNKLYRRDCLTNVSYPVGNFVGEDYVIVTQVLEKAECVVWIEIPLYHYLQQKGSMCLGGFNRKNFFLGYEYHQSRMNAMKKEFPQLSQCIDNYLVTELLSYVVKMGRNQNYDKEVLQIIRNTVKRNFWQYISANYIEMKYKMSAVGLVLHYKFVVWAYELIYKF